MTAMKIAPYILGAGLLTAAATAQAVDQPANSLTQGVNLATTSMGGNSTSQAAAQNPPPMAPVLRKIHAPPQPGEVRTMEIRELGNFEYDPKVGGNIPADVQALSGMKVRLHGYMAPLSNAAQFTDFLLVPSLFNCCFGQPPQVQHTIVCHTVSSKGITYSPDEVRVEGTLKIDEKKDDGFCVSVFDLEVDSVQPMGK